MTTCTHVIDTRGTLCANPAQAGTGSCWLPSHGGAKPATSSGRSFRVGTGPVEPAPPPPLPIGQRHGTTAEKLHADLTMWHHARRQLEDAIADSNREREALDRRLLDQKNADTEQPLVPRSEDWDGTFHDQVAVTDPDGVTYFHRLGAINSDSTVYPDYPDQLRLQASRALTDEECRRAAQALGYTYQVAVRGEGIGTPERDSAASFVVYADTTKTRRDDFGDALVDLDASYQRHLTEGSPIRTTNKAGHGTKGTRLVEGFNDPDLTFELYYNNAQPL